MKRKVTLQGLALLLVLGATTNVFANTKDNIKIEVVGGGNIDIYDNDKSEVANKKLNQKEENNNIPYSKDEYQYLLINFKEPFTEERYKELVESGISVVVSDSRLENTINSKSTIILNSKNFPDEYFRKAITEAFGVNEGADITRQIQSARKFELSRKLTPLMYNIIGMEHFINLEDLNLGGYSNGRIGNINNLSPIRDLTNLRVLDVIGNPIKDLEPIENLVNLEKLSLSATDVSALNHISKLNKLTFLSIHDTKIPNNLPTLRYLPKTEETLEITVDGAIDFQAHTPNHTWYTDKLLDAPVTSWGQSQYDFKYYLDTKNNNLSIGSVNIRDKTYDGNTNATIDNVNFTGLLGKDTLQKGVDYNVVATYDNADVGNSKNVTVNITPLNTRKMRKYNLINNNFRTTGNIIKANSSISGTRVLNGNSVETTTFDFSDRLVVEATPRLRANINEMELVLNNQVVARQNSTLGNKVTFNYDLSNLALGQGSYELKLRYGGNNNVNGTEESLGNITINKVKLKAEINESIEYNGTNTFEVGLKNIKNKKDNNTINGITGTATIQLNTSNVGNYNAFNVNNIKINGDTYNHYEFENQNSDITGNINVTKKPITINSAIVEDKTYDSNTNAVVDNVSFNGLVGGQDLEKGVDYNVSATFNDENVGTNKQVTLNINLLGTQKASNYQLTNNTFQTTGNIIKANSRLDNIKIKNSKGIATTTFDFSDILVVEAMPKLRINVNEMELVLNNQVIAKQNATLGNKITFNVDLSNLSIGQGSYELKLRYGGNNNVNGTEESLGNITINKVKLKAEINESIEYNGTNIFEVSLKNIKTKKDDTIINSIAGTAIIQLNNSNAGNYNTFTVNNIKINGDKLNHYEFENQSTDITGNMTITKSNIKDISSEIYVTNKLEKDYIFNLEDNLPVLEDNKTFGNIEFTNLIYNDIEKGYLKETPTIDKNMLKIKTNKNVSEEEKLLGKITIDVTSTNYNNFKLKLKLNSTNKVKPKLNVKQKDILTYGDKLNKLNLDFQAIYNNKEVDGSIKINEDLETILNAGNHKISVTFIPKDNNKYDMVQVYVDVKVEKALAKAIEQPKITEITENEKTLSQSKFITKGKFQGINNKIINEDDYTLEWENGNEIVTQGKAYSYNMINNNYYIIEKQIPFKILDGNNQSGNNENNNGSNNGNNNNSNINNGNGADIGNKPNTDDNSNNKEDNEIGNDNLFDDLPNDHFAKDEIEYLYKKGIVKGYNRLIRPNEPITRAEFAILLNNTSEYLGVNTNNLADEVYIDVYKDKYYYNGIYKATYLDTMIGYNDKTFKPDNNMTREETVVSIYKLISLCNINIELSYPTSFTDYKDISTWSKPYFDELNSKGIIKGNNEKFRPKESITRAEAMVLIYNLLNK
ncbi:MAG: S-layer homology domain-containing protein [Clostridiales bacterium]|nr:S-layer homology domain-containing protein [Clostridiales bacterium]